jgi:hypothetical protein
MTWPRSNRPHADRDDRILAELRAELAATPDGPHPSTDAIAARYSIPRKTAGRLRERVGYPAPPTVDAIIEQHGATIRRMVREGATKPEIANAIGVRTVERTLERMGLRTAQSRDVTPRRR